MTAAIEHWPLAQSFSISRGTKTEATVIVAEISEGVRKGRGECTPYARYGETPEAVLQAIEAMKTPLAQGMDRRALQSAMPKGAARNAIDCALWDLEAKRAQHPVHELASLPPLRPVTTAYTISLDTPEAMAASAAKNASWPLLKIKLGRTGDAARLSAIRQAVPQAQLIVDANEGWTPDNLAENFAACQAAGVTLIEQPLPQAEDDILKNIAHSVALCADESMSDCASLKALSGKYEAVNIKLDKTGGLTEALAAAQLAKEMGFSIMTGCMVATSLAMAPAFLLAQQAQIVDLDGALLLAKDRPQGISYDNHIMQPPLPVLWG